MYCKHCGAEVPEGYKYCTKCGAKIEPVAAQQASQQAEPVKPELPKTAHEKPQKSGSTKKAVWIGIVTAVIIILIAALVFVLVHSHQQNNVQDTAATTVSTTQAQTSAASKETHWLADTSLLTDDYIERYRNDLLGKLDSENSQIVETGFSKADDVNHIKGQTHNSLCFIVETNGKYCVYEYADIKIDGNNNLLPPTYKGRTSQYFNTWEGMENYMSDKPTDTYHYTMIE